MNVIPGTIQQIQVHQSLSLIKIQAQSLQLSAIVIDTPDTCTYLREGNPIKVIFKETEVILGHGHHHPISLQNQLDGYVELIKTSQLLSKVIVRTEVGPVTSIITTNAVRQLKLHINSPVSAMIKTNEVMLSE